MIKIIADSSAYLRKQEASELGVRIVPLTYSAGDRNYSENFSDQNGNFTELLKSGAKFSTSQPNPSAFLSCFEEELAAGNEVLCLTISSRLSGTYSAAYMAAKQTESKNIAVMDSHLTAGGLYLLIKEAKKLIEAGENLSDIASQLLPVRERIAIAFSVDDMTPLRNSGRIGMVRMGVGTILNVRPILVCQEGGIVFDRTVRGDREIIRALTEKVPKNAEAAVINYICNNKLASNLYNVIKEKHPALPLTLQKLGPVLGIHLGLHVVGLSIITP
jgi:DegV family protein with EDD domain